jgi:hypothetical protein
MKSCLFYFRDKLNNESFDKDINSTKKEKNEKSNKLYLKRNTHTHTDSLLLLLLSKRKTKEHGLEEKKKKKGASGYIISEKRRI